MTKRTLPGGDAQAFTFTASAPNGAYLGYSYKQANGTYGSITPVLPNATGPTTTTLTLQDAQSVRVYMSVTSTARTLSLSEAATAGWEASSQISCTNVVGAPGITTAPASRSMTASLSTTNAAAACTFTNTKSATVTLAKNLPARVNSTDQFTVSASKASGSIIGTSSATTSGSGTSASTTFTVTPYTAASPNTVTLTDAVASGSGTTLTNYTPSLTCTGAAGSYNGTLPSNQATYTGTVQPTPGGALSCTFTNLLPTLTVNKTVSASYLKYDRQASGTFQPTPGTLTYTVTVTNSAATARTVQVTDTLPTGLQNVTVKDSGSATVPVTTTGGAALTQPIAGPTTGSTDIRWTAGDLNAGDTRTYTVSATAVTLNAAPASNLSAIQNLVTLSAVNQVGTKTSAASTNVIFPVMTKSVQNLTQGTAVGTNVSARPGERLRYCIDARNAGSITLNNYTITDAFPANTSFVAGSASISLAPSGTGTVTSNTTQVSGTVASLAPNATATLCFNVQVN